MPTPYKKYGGGKAIHWEWYKENKDGYADLVDASLKFLIGCKGSVLDIGSGDGLIDSLLIKQGFEVIGIEPSVDGIKIAGNRVPQMQQHMCTIEEYVKFSAVPKVDYLYSMCTIEHVEDDSAFVAVMSSVKQFALIFTDNAAVRDKPGRHHFREYTIEQLENLFKDFKTDRLKVGDNRFIGLKVYAK